MPMASRPGSQNTAGTVKLRMRASPEVTVVARMRTSTSLSLGSGCATSIRSSTSGEP